MFLVDTNVASDARRERPEITRWLRSVHPHSIYLSVITLGEINRGALSLQSKDPVSAGHLLAWLGTLRQEYRQRTLPITAALQSSGAAFPLDDHAGSATA